MVTKKNKTTKKTGTKKGKTTYMIEGKSFATLKSAIKYAESQAVFGRQSFTIMKFSGEDEVKTAGTYSNGSFKPTR